MRQRDAPHRGDGPVPPDAGGPGTGSVRPMTPRDVPGVMAIESAAFTVPWTATTFRSLLERDGAALWVAESGGEVVGYAAVWTAADQAELGNVAVAEGYRRQGIATTLIETVLAWLRGRGIREVFLEVRPSNRAARQLYAGHGFREVARRRGYYSRPREDALVLRLPLEPGADRLTD